MIVLRHEVATGPGEVRVQQQLQRHGALPAVAKEAHQVRAAGDKLLALMDNLAGHAVAVKVGHLRVLRGS